MPKEPRPTRAKRHSTKTRRRARSTPRPPQRQNRALVAQSTTGRPGIVRIAAGADTKRHLVLDARLRELAGQMSQSMFLFMDAASEVIKDKLYAAMHYQEPEEYFGQRIGFSYRSLRRRLAIHEAVKRLEEDEQPAVRAALVELGIHRAAILAPVIGKDGESWRTWVKNAKRLDEDQLQEAVSKATSAKARGRHDRKGSTVKGTDEQWLNDTLALLPADAREEVQQVFEAGLVVLKHPEKIPRLQVFLVLVRNAKVELFHEAQEQGWKPS